jgi:molybdate/tungstate transport system ATP-binding protein
LIRLENISLNKGNFKLENITLKINKNSYFIILGKTGAGKTMLLESIAGLHKVKGNIFVNNKDITNIPTEKRNIGFVYQDFALFPHLTVKQNIEFSKKYKKHLSDKELNALLEILDIKNLLNRKIDNLSGGEKQRVALSRAIYSNPDILLLDEPLSAVDPSFRTKIMDNLKSLIDKFDLTIIHVTHNFREASYLSDEVAIMLNGKIVQQGNIHTILNRPKNKQVAEFLGFKNIFPVTLINKYNVNSQNDYFSIEPTEILYSQDELDTPYQFKGKFLNYVEQTDHFKIYVKVDDYIFFIKRAKNNSILDEIELNKEVFIGFSQENIHIMKGTNHE